MKRLWLLLLLVFISITAPNVQAASTFVEDARFNPKQSYSWITSGSDKYVDFSSGQYKYRVYDRGTQWEAVVLSGNGLVFMCDPINTESGCGLMSGKIAKNQVNFPGGYLLIFGHNDVVPDPPPTVEISPDSTEFSDYVDVTITGSFGSTVYYSLDGSEPSVPYTKAIRITETTTVKAKAVSTTTGLSGVASKTYTKKKPPDPDPPDPDPGGGGTDPGGGTPNPGGGNDGTGPGYDFWGDTNFLDPLWKYTPMALKIGMPILLILIAIVVVELVAVMIIDAVKAARKKKDDDDDDW